MVFIPYCSDRNDILCEIRFFVPNNDNQSEEENEPDEEEKGVSLSAKAGASDQTRLGGAREGCS